jgi:hypothetical protein
LTKEMTPKPKKAKPQTAITKESVWAAADALVAKGKRPTLDALRTELGGGSYTYIQSHITTWKEKHGLQNTSTTDVAILRFSEDLSKLCEDVEEIRKDVAQIKAALEDLRGIGSNQLPEK